MLEKILKRIILIICLILSLSFFAWELSKYLTYPNERVIAIAWNEKQITVNGNEYVLMEDSGRSGTWECERSITAVNQLGKIRIWTDLSFYSGAKIWASNEDPPICLCVGTSYSPSCYLLKSYTLPPKLSASFSSIDFGKDVFFDFDNAVSMEDIISCQNAISDDEDYEMEWIDNADLYYSEHDMIYLYVGIYRINDEFYIRLDDVYYPIVMPEILDYLNTKK